MENQFNINIKTPCTKDFNLFSSTSNGGFCNSCEREVIDFTLMNSKDIMNYFKNKNNENTCGRFKQQQLNMNYPVPQQRKKLSLLSGIGLACLSLFSILTVQAQDTKNHESTKNTQKVNAVQFQEKFTVKGYVSDETGPLAGVNISLEGSSIGTQTDFEGDFEFPVKLKKGDVLIFSYVGLKSKKITINNKDTATNVELKVNMKLDDIVLMGKVAVKEVYKSKHNK